MVSVVNVENMLIQKKESLRLIVEPELLVISDLEQIVTEDDTAVDNIFSEKQQRLLVEPLYSSWQDDRIFWAAANVGLFNSPDESPIVPDMFLSMNVKVGENWYEKQNRSYFVWRLGKLPEVVVEIISNKKGYEADKKWLKYARIGVKYYVLYDPFMIIQNEKLKVFELNNGEYKLKENYYLDDLGLSLTLRMGEFEGDYKEWLRWCDMNGELIQTGLEWGEDGWERAKQEWERAEQERERAEEGWEKARQEQQNAKQGWEKAREEQNRAEQEQKRAEQEQERAEKLAAQLRLLGIEPE